ncbi:MAG: S46 family peptidase [Bacteroidales bacterium]
MKKLLLLLLPALLLCGTAKADEGMWLLPLVKRLNIEKMQELGCELSAEDIYNINNTSLKDAIVALDHGSCTAELVSEKGLLLTNHHCGYGEIQAHSSVEHDYLKDGFWARSLKEELPNPGKTVTFLIRAEDVTEKLTGAIHDDGDGSDHAFENTINALVDEASENNKYEVDIVPMFEGNQYFMFVYITYKDIRLVGAPPSSIGKFGADTDNWMWPRHTGDFSMFRIYTAPDGSPAEYSEDNIPYDAPYHLPISIEGVEDGDYTMVLGYPGSTDRYATSFGVENTRDYINSVREEVRAKKLEILGNYMKTSDKARIQYASKYARSSNYYKYSIGQNKGIENLDVVGKKQNLEKKLTDWINETSDRKDKYGDALKVIQESYSDTDKSAAQTYLIEAILSGPEAYQMGRTMSTIVNILKASKDEDSGRLKEVAAKMKEGLPEIFKDYDTETDKKVAIELMKIYIKNVNPKYYPDFVKTIVSKYKGDTQKYFDKAYANSIVVNRDKAEAFLDNPTLKAARKDVFISTSKEALDAYRKIYSEGGAFIEARKQLLAALMEMDADKSFYPDANSTMRLTYGTVGSYEPHDAVEYKYFTTHKGYLEKEIPGDSEFDVKPRMKQLLVNKDFGRYADENGDLRICFISNNDITGGNSGSPVINGKGQLVGLAFDGNWEAMSGDIAFEPELQRCINVDIRFVLWIIDKYAGAQNLIDEMTIID